MREWKTSEIRKTLTPTPLVKQMKTRILIIKYNKHHPFSMLNHEPSATFRGGLDFHNPEGRKGPKRSPKPQIQNPIYIFIFEWGVGVPFCFTPYLPQLLSKLASDFNHTGVSAPLGGVPSNVAPLFLPALILTELYKDL